MAHEIPCLASRWADEYAEAQDAHEAQLNALADDPDRVEYLALIYLEKNYPDLEFDTDEQWQQWIADEWDRIVEWSL